MGRGNRVDCPQRQLIEISDCGIGMANGGGATANTAKTAQQSSLVRTALGMGARVLEEIEE